MVEREKEKSKKSQSFFDTGRTKAKTILKEGETEADNLRIWLNICAAALGFLFGGCHIAFGTYPLGLGFVSALPSSVWPALLGVVCGSLTLGKSGIIYGMICVLAVFLRVVISGGEKKDDGGNGVMLFFEKRLLRVCSAVIGGFVSALYELLLGGISFSAVLFGASMIILSGASAFLFSGIFYHGIGVKALVVGEERVFSGKNNEGIEALFFKISILSYLLLISLSLNKYKIFGIDLSLVFSAGITLFSAKRFGALYAAIVGFTSSVGISGLYSVAFALLGASSGALFSFGAWYALIGGGVLLSVWGAYAGGVSGFLTVFPEFLIGTSLILPLFRHLEREKPEEVYDTEHRRATDMVGTMALSYRSKKALAVEALEDAFLSLVPRIKDFCENEVMTESYTVFYKLIGEAKINLLRDREMDEALTDELESVFSNLGFKEGVIRAFGGRYKYIICSAEDKDGVRITSPALREGIEEASELKFSVPEYFRRGDMVLMECESVAKYKLESAFCQSHGKSEPISGDTVGVIKSKDLFTYGLISDGMGSGEEAKRTSEFILEFFGDMTDSMQAGASMLQMLNSIVRRNREECGATVDLFVFDQINKEAAFIKSGAVPSYVKRGSSLFRIKSETMPLGFIKQLDAERVAVSVSVGDYIIMISDGVCQIGEEAGWLVDFLNLPAPEDINEYAASILEVAKKNGKGEDDMSVLVLKVALV